MAPDPGENGAWSGAGLCPSLATRSAGLQGGRGGGPSGDSCEGGRVSPRGQSEHKITPNFLFLSRSKGPQGCGPLVGGAVREAA